MKRRAVFLTALLGVGTVVLVIGAIAFSGGSRQAPQRAYAGTPAANASQGSIEYFIDRNDKEWGEVYYVRDGFTKDSALFIRVGGNKEGNGARLYRYSIAQKKSIPLTDKFTIGEHTSGAGFAQKVGDIVWFSIGDTKVSCEIKTGNVEKSPYTQKTKTSKESVGTSRDGEPLFLVGGDGQRKLGEGQANSELVNSQGEGVLSKQARAKLTDTTLVTVGAEDKVWAETTSYTGDDATERKLATKHELKSVSFDGTTSKSYELPYLTPTDVWGAPRLSPIDDTPAEEAPYGAQWSDVCEDQYGRLWMAFAIGDLYAGYTVSQ